MNVFFYNVTANKIVKMMTQIYIQKYQNEYHLMTTDVEKSRGIVIQKFETQTLAEQAISEISNMIQKNIDLGKTDCIFYI